MTMFRKIAFTLPILVGVLSFSANAAIVEIDWKVAGDGRAFLDESTGTEWVSLNETKGRSINFFDEAKTGLGGFYEGFRVANRADIAGLFGSIVDLLTAPANNGFVENQVRPGQFESYVNSETDYFGARDIGLVMGNVATTSAFILSRGFYKNEGDGRYFPSSALSSYVYAYRGFRREGLTNEAVIVTESSASSAHNYNTALSDYGVFLVSDGGATLSTREDPSLLENNPLSPGIAEVPEPAGAALLSAGLLGLLVVRKKKVKK